MAGDERSSHKTTDSQSLTMLGDATQDLVVDEGETEIQERQVGAPAKDNRVSSVRDSDAMECKRGHVLREDLDRRLDDGKLG